MQAFERVWTQLITRITGDAWNLTDKVLEELRAKKYRGLTVLVGENNGGKSNVVDAIRLLTLPLSGLRSLKSPDC